ncbi:uncharacterized protein LOC110725991 [Chenopodium quinoa]|uniref:uncharacterized protein LOC110725991 n=1 Tax=Chenopodium quinoa TaxID=63459 RepID=UPI000B785550|nr:uncharacterized protein LOC110725991 [Chenopodium quinoa]
MTSKKLRPYFLAHSIVVYTDQPLKKPFTTLEASGRMLKWALEMRGFDIAFEPRKAIKGQAFGDFLAEMTRPDLQPAGDQIWKVFVDGSATATGCGAGVICQSLEGDKFEYAMRFQFQASNNEAEYEALLADLRLCKAAGATKVDVSSDSLLVVGQVNGDFEAREAAMMKYLKIVKDEAKGLDHFTLQQVPRSSNHQADTLSKLASSASCDTPRSVFWEVKERRSIDAEPVHIIDRSSTWMDGIISYLKDGLLPADPKDSWLMKKRSACFEMKQGELFKNAFVKPYLKCITPEKRYDVLDDLHQGQCGSHIGGRDLAKKAAHLGYYWPSLKSDSMKMVKKCNKCQRFATLIHRPANSLSAISSPLPFAKWGMDILGPYTPTSGKRRYVFVVVDYFTKWVEAEAVRGIKWTDVSAFIWKSIIIRFGVPQSMVFDNGTQFETPQLKEWLEDQGIAYCFASVGRAQANGQVEAYNKLISNGIKRKLERADGLWADELVNVLWSI